MVRSTVISHSPVLVVFYPTVQLVASIVLMKVVMDMIGKDEVEVKNKEDDEGGGEAEGGHDQPLLQLHGD